MGGKILRMRRTDNDIMGGQETDEGLEGGIKKT